MNQPSFLTQNTCRICTGTNKEIKIILTSLKKQLSKKKLQNADENWNKQQIERKINHLKAFSRFIDGLSPYQTDSRCQHQKIYNKYFRKVGLSNQATGQFFEEIIEKRGFTTYQIDLLTQQIDQIKESITEIIKNKRVPQKDKRKLSKQEKQEREVKKEQIAPNCNNSPTSIVKKQEIDENGQIQSMKGMIEQIGNGHQPFGYFGPYIGQWTNTMPHWYGNFYFGQHN